jgi:hypothetical protein
MIFSFFTIFKKKKKVENKSGQTEPSRGDYAVRHARARARAFE